ncbi:hypothetical protein [Acidobacterium sp. S8]|uniref:hypothetical protein n=1 Tax=Acidobacterium sp. S8 TaxID=1641854 RepID=UPI00131DE821|nr:hypothetical protein [Acidobacterium sp. S8]
MTTREKLTNATYDSLEAMMQAYAGEAVRMAASEHGIKLDYSTSSIAELENILNSLTPVENADLEWVTKLWGGYFGEVFRRRYDAEWTMSVYPGGQLAVPTLEIGGSRIYPLLKVQRRLTMGAGENLASFFDMAIKRLDAVRPLTN